MACSTSAVSCRRPNWRCWRRRSPTPSPARRRPSKLLQELPRARPVARRRGAGPAHRRGPFPRLRGAGACRRRRAQRRRAADCGAQRSLSLRQREEVQALPRGPRRRPVRCVPGNQRCRRRCRRQRRPERVRAARVRPPAATPAAAGVPAVRRCARPRRRRRAPPRRSRRRRARIPGGARRGARSSARHALPRRGRVPAGASRRRAAAARTRRRGIAGRARVPQQPGIGAGRRRPRRRGDRRLPARAGPSSPATRSPGTTSASRCGPEPARRAIAAFGEAPRLAPHSPRRAGFSSLALLASGRFEEGWLDYDARLSSCRSSARYRSDRRRRAGTASPRRPRCC